jgi:hypothetical protein
MADFRQGAEWDEVRPLPKAVESVRSAWVREEISGCAEAFLRCV